MAGTDGACNQKIKNTRSRRGAKTLWTEILSADRNSIRVECACSKVLTHTDAHILPVGWSASPSFLFGSRQATPPLAGKTKTAPRDPLTPSWALAYYTPPPTSQKTPQSLLCSKPHEMCPLVSDTNQNLLIQVPENSFQAHQAERQHWTHRSRNSQSLVAAIATFRVFNTKEGPPSTGITFGRIHLRPSQKTTTGTTRDHAFPNKLIKFSPSDLKPRSTPELGHPQKSSSTEEGSFDSVSFFQKRNCRLSVIVGRDGAVSTPLSTGLSTGVRGNPIYEDH